MTEPLGGSEGDVKVVCLGASAGGLEALSEFFGALPGQTRAAFIVVVHLSPDYKSLMRELLARRSRLEVSTARDGEALAPGHVYIIPPGANMRLRSSHLQLEPQDRRPGHGLNLPIDLFLRSMAEDVGHRSAAIILSGTGSDGSRGIRRVKEVGGMVLAQRPSSAKFDGMPVSALQTGTVDAEGTPTDLARHIHNLIVLGPPELPSIDEDDYDDIDAGTPADPDAMAPRQQVSYVLRRLAERGPDLSYLRPRMVLRRLQRRMGLTGFRDLKSYIGHLEADPFELDRLGSDLLIGVTHFFRDPDVLETLKAKVFTKLVPAVPSDEALRIWVAACSTGQEAYTLLMLLLDFMELTGTERDVKMFATDINERALHRASRGMYSLSEVADIPPALLSRYFEQQGGQFVVRASLRSRVIFARHNAIIDPPFTRMDLVSCRNLLVYLRPRAQQQLLSSLYTALHPGRGHLLLGTAEEVADLQDALPVVDSRAKVYRRSTEPTQRLVSTRVLNEPIAVIRSPPNTSPPPSAADAQLGLLRMALETSFEAAGESGALIDAEGRLLDVVADALGVFRMPKGRPSDELARILPSALAQGLLTAYDQRRGDDAPVSIAVAAPEPGPYRLVLRPLASGVVTADRFLLLVSRHRDAVSSPPPSQVDQDAMLHALERELRRTKERLQATIEELQSASEEQQSTNEELVASNEELQSTNEELQSVNEELVTVNLEYQQRNEELLEVSGDLDNLLRSLSVGTLYLDNQLCVRRYTTTLTSIIPLRDSDIGRPIADLGHGLDIDLVAAVTAVRDRVELSEREVRDKSGAWLLLRIHPYQGPDGSAEGVLITLVDVTRIKNAEESARVVGQKLASTNAQLEDQAEQLEDLFSIVAHDLKRPILGLDGLLSLGRRSLEEGDRQGAADHLKDAHVSLAALRDLLRDLIQLAQDTRADPVREDVDLGRWLDEMMAPFATRASDQGVQLTWVCDGKRATISRAAAAGVLNNLVENAFLYGTTGTNPRIEVLCQDRGSTVRVMVADNGAGIAAGDQEKVFELFRRLEPDRGEGSGVGLVAARRLAARAGGTVTLESAPGQGARFVLELPAGAVPSLKPVAGATRVRGGQILLVEDDAVDSKRVQRILTKYDLTTVSSLRAAHDLLSTRGYDLLLLDISLPDGHGLTLLRDMHDTINRDTPVILLTGHAEGLDQGALQGLQVISTLDKEVLVGSALLEKVQEHLGEWS